jgi:hypothetical protein
MDKTMAKAKIALVMDFMIPPDSRIAGQKYVPHGSLYRLAHAKLEGEIRIAGAQTHQPTGLQSNGVNCVTLPRHLVPLAFTKIVRAHGIGWTRMLS